MWFLRANDRGVTLIEILIAAIIVSILTALATPSLIGLMSGNKVKGAQEQIQATFRDAQRQAIRNGRSCEVQINTSSNPVTVVGISTDPVDSTKKSACLTASNLELPKDVKVATNLLGTPPKLKYNFKGQTNKGGTVVFYSTNAKEKRCLVVSLYLGMMRTGDYTGSDPSKPEPDNCSTTNSSL